MATYEEIYGKEWLEPLHCLKFQTPLLCEFLIINFLVPTEDCSGDKLSYASKIYA